MADIVVLAFGALLIVLCSLFVASAVTHANKLRMLARYKEAFERGDAAECLRLRELVRAGLPDTKLTRESEKVGQGEMCLLHEQWADARDVLEGVDRSILPIVSRPGVLSNLAYATAQAGEPERAIALVRQALAEAAAQGEEYPAEKLPYLRGTHGVALSLAGRHDEAIEWLDPLVAIAHPPRARSARAFYVARSYRALGRFAESAQAYVIASQGEGPFAERARAALGTLNPHRG